MQDSMRKNTLEKNMVKTTIDAKINSSEISRNNYVKCCINFAAEFCK